MKPFVPAPGQIDFSKARWAPVLNTVVRYRGKILLVKRSRNMNLYPAYWNGISGFLDDQKSLEEKVQEELFEETGISPEAISKITLCGIFNQEAPDIGKTWIVHAVLAEVTTDQITLDWEAETYVWVDPSRALDYQLLPGFAAVLAAVSGAAPKLSI